MAKRKRKQSNFSKMRSKLKRKGYSHSSATKIAASAGIKKYGKKGMAKKSAAARKRNKRRRKK